MTEWELDVTLDIFEYIVRGKKNIEGRAPDPSNSKKDYRKMRITDTLLFFPVDKNFKRIKGKHPKKYIVTYVHRYRTLDEMLEDIGETRLNRLLPNVKTIEKAKEVYLSFPGYEKRIKKYGMVAIDFRRL